MEHETQRSNTTENTEEHEVDTVVYKRQTEVPERKIDKAFRYRNVVVRERNVDVDKTSKGDIPFHNKKLQSDCDTCLSCDLRKHLSEYCCTQCEVYLCSNCNQDHAGHSTCTADQGLSSLVDELIHEQNREDTLSETEICPCSTIDVSSGVDDEKCWITGCSFPDKNHVIACDYNNDCLKIIEVCYGTFHFVERYIRISYGPWNVKCVENDNENSSESEESSSIENNIPKADKSDTDSKIRNQGNSFSINQKQIIAVTCPDVRQIIFVDITTKPAVKLKTLRVDGECFDIEILKNKIFTSCKEPHNQYRMTIHILDLKGNVFNIINTEFYSGRQWAPPCFVLHPEKEIIYFTSGYHGVVQCVHFSGEVIATFTDNGPGLRGICMDEAQNLYVCANNDDAIFKLSPDLTQCDVIIDKGLIRMKWPQSVSMYRDKLYISHYFREYENIQNHINVVRIL